MTTVPLLRSFLPSWYQAGRTRTESGRRRRHPRHQPHRKGRGAAFLLRYRTLGKQKRRPDAGRSSEALDDRRQVLLSHALTAAHRLGMALIRNAFAVGSGMLTDMTETPAEQQPTSDLFADETGYYKNPLSHRAVALNDPAEAAEIIILASHLLRVAEKRAGGLDDASQDRCGLQSRCFCSRSPTTSSSNEICVGLDKVASAPAARQSFASSG